MHVLAEGLFREPGRVVARAGARHVVVLAALFATVASAQAPDGATVLAEMASAMRTLDYQGSFIYQHSGRIDTLRVFHSGSPRERERLISLNGPRSEVIRSGSTITCIQPDNSAILYSNSPGRGLLPLVPDTADESLGEHYRISVSGTDRVAGYSADIVDIIPRDAYRYGYRLWVESGTRLLLKSVVTDSKRKPLEQIMFVSLEIGTPPNDTDLVPSQSNLLSTTAARGDEIELRGGAAWEVARPPPGFTFRSARRSRDAEKGAQHLVYSDGLASVSIYVEPRIEGSAEVTTLAGRGTMNIYTYSDKRWQFTVLGDVPVATVTAIAQSLVLKEGSTHPREPAIGHGG
jgi:sigma-E factor negative regulatory protein RseB